MKRSLSALFCWFLAPAAFAILDTNQNGVSDFWERDVHNGSLFDEFFDPQADDDSDGWTNTQEAEAGTNPFDPNPPDGLIRPFTEHVPAVIEEENGVPVVKTPEAVKVTWPTLTGKQYTMYFSPDLTQESWLPVGSPFIAQGGVSEYGFYELSVADKRFWRVAVEDVDTDGDGLSDHEEHLFGTEYWNPETFGGIPDAWLALHYATANGFNPDDDDDNDGLGNFDEYLHGTNPKLADTDDDGTSDFAEINHGGNPNDASDGGTAPADLLEEVAFTVGGDYASWRMEIHGKGPRDQRILRLASQNPGDTETRTFKLHRNNRYEITLHRTGGVEDWYCWEARVNNLPDTATFDEAEGYYQLGERNDQSHFFTVADHWLVDNRQGLLTGHLHSYQNDVASPLKAELVPVAIEDNIEATGVDIVSNSVAPDVPGYRDKLWIMAPIAGPPPPADYSNEMKFNIPLNPAAVLDMECDHATPDPATITLDGSKPAVLWRGSGANETSDNTTTFKLGEHDDEVDLPIGVMTMKHRTVSVVVWPVNLNNEPGIFASVEERNAFEAALKVQLDRIFGFQINAWSDVSVGINKTFDYLDGMAGGSPATPYTLSHGTREKDMIDAYRDVTYDINVFLINNVHYSGDPLNPLSSMKLGSSYPVNFPGTEGRENCVIVNMSAYYTNSTNQPHTIAHEIGHLLLGPGHPNQHQANDPGSGGPAPLPSLPAEHPKRLMYSSSSLGKMLVKGEWDEAENWLGERPNGDN